MTSSNNSDLFMHPQSCIIEEVQEEGTSCASHSPEHAAGSTAAAGVPSTGHTSSGSDPQVAESSSQPDAADAAAASTEAETSILQPSEAAAEASSNAEQPVDAELQQLLVDCDRLKQEGNAAYARGEYDEALQLYWQAIDQAPEDAQQRSVYLCNAAACYLKKEMWQLAVEQCTAALSINDAYVKALMRRSQALQQLDDLERALADAQRVLELDPGNSWAPKVVQELQPEVQQRQEKVKEEMIGKLKDLGNSILGKFGMSLDNFKAEQDPATGGYSIKFVQ